MKHAKNYIEKIFTVYKLAFWILGAVAFVYSICFLVFYYSYRGKFISRENLTPGNLVEVQVWTKILLALGNAWLTSFFIWIILWISQFFILRRFRLAWIMSISFAGFLLAIFIDYILNLNGGPGSWYAGIMYKM